MKDLLNFDEPLAEALKHTPAQILPVFESATRAVYRNHYALEMPDSEVPSFQVTVSSGEHERMLRDLQSNLMGQLVVIPGIVTAASKSAIKATKEVLKCQNCGHEKHIKIKLGYGGARHPQICEGPHEPGQERPKCPMNPYRVVTEKCTFVDQQTLKLQEAPELIPTGEMPRTIQLTVDRELTDKVTPGNRVRVVGILSLLDSAGQSDTSASKQVKSTVRPAYIRVVGLTSHDNKNNSGSVSSFAMPSIT